MAGFRTTTDDTSGTLDLGAAFGRAIVSSGLPGLVIDLRGDLGAGKTVFVRGLATGLGLSETTRVVSPTFTIARDYAVDAGPIRALHHLDAYRLTGGDDLDAVGFEEMCGTGRLTCVEWGEYVQAALPEDRVRVSLTPLPPPDLQPGEAPECPREVVFEGLGPAGDRAVAALALAWQEAGRS